VTDLPDWVADYIGIPFVSLGRDPATGLDCYGLCRHVLSRHAGIDLPSYADGYAGTSHREAQGLARLLDAGKTLIDAREVPAGDARLFDLVLIRMAGQPCHVGVLLQPGLMLHAEDGVGVSLATLQDSRWSRRVMGYYRVTTG
jgi:cell wall-associated NlpC family hydrolase